MGTSYFSSTEPTARHIRLLLPRILSQISGVYQDRPDLVLAAWPAVVGPELAPMTQALSFIEGTLTVSVANSTLYSLLARHDKARILKSLRDKFPHIQIKTIHFRLGQ